jgi:hypothetical protein
VDDQQTAGLYLEEPRSRPDRSPDLVHVRLGLEEREPEVVEP